MIRTCKPKRALIGRSDAGARWRERRPRRRTGAPGAGAFYGGQRAGRLGMTFKRRDGETVLGTRCREA